MTKYILLTGANGQLGNELQNVLKDRNDVVTYYTDVNELDITSSEAIGRFFKENRIDYVVNCAAFTAVDKAESEKELCHMLNAQSVALLAKESQAHGAKMIQISTDYVFDGNGHRPYMETDKPAPCSVYGTTKLEGESNLMELAPHSIIIRTAWLYSPYGHNFVKTMLNLGKTKPSLKVIYDQVGTPTYALDLARAIVKIIDYPHWHPGIYHFSDEGAISWYDFTKAIHRIAGITNCQVNPCTTEEYPTPAHRPHYSVFNKNKIKTTFGLAIPYWEDSLKDCIKRLEQVI